MSDELVFYTHPMSRGRIVRWMLEEVGAPYDTQVVDYGAPMKGEDYRAINPMGKVPALRHGETVVTECAAILAYLADAFPGAGLAPPANSRLRGPYYRWLFFAAGPLEAAVTNNMLGVEVPQDKQGMVGYGSLQTVLDTIEAALDGRDTLVGDSFTAADLYLSAHIGWGMRFGTIEERKVFSRYVEPHLARPAGKRANEIDDALMPNHPMPGA
ncbi:MAG: glutathione S-transferase family protein [Dichotomicrobium sp.]